MPEQARLNLREMLLGPVCCAMGEQPRLNLREMSGARHVFDSLHLCRMFSPCCCLNNSMRARKLT
eukprot:10585121-Alexandrium_andersonii.AAC.1